MACASSLAAVHQAVAGLKTGEVDLALAGGVNVILSPSVSRFMMDVGMLSPNGDCTPFDASADGYVRGEASGMIALKRLSDAEADGDRIWAVIRASAVNQNGASAGLTVPNGSAQERVMREALNQAGIAPSEVDYLEAHAVGSQLGDPIEINAAATVYGEGRPNNKPLIVGSVKSNLGHVEWAAGITALTKTVLAMNRGTIPQHLHFDQPNPYIEWEDLPIKVASSNTEWPNGSRRPPIAGVNAFGMSGTNAHVLIEGYAESSGSNGYNGELSAPVGATKPTVATRDDANDEDDEDIAPRRVRFLPLSGKSPSALRDLAQRYSDWFEAQDETADTEWISDVAWTAAIGRSHFDHRAGIVHSDTAELVKGLRNVIGNLDDDDQLETNLAKRVAFAYSDTADWTSTTAKALYETEPAFRTVLDRCDTAVNSEQSLIDNFLDSAGNTPLNLPTTYALDCALTALWQSLGIRPNVVYAHGFGELAAAQAVGMISLEDGFRFATLLNELEDARKGSGSFEAASANLESAFRDLKISDSTAPLINTANGENISKEDILQPSRWLNRQKIGSGAHDYTDSLLAHQIDLVLQFGADESLTLQQRESSRPLVSMPALIPDTHDPKNTDGNTSFVKAVARAYEHGLDITWQGLFAKESRRRVSIPLYPFQRRKHWFA